MSRLFVLLTLVCAIFALDANSQTYSVRLGASKISGNVPAAGTFTFLAGPAEPCGIVSYTTISQAPMISSAPSFSSVTGIQRGFFCKPELELFGTAQGGVAANLDATAGIFKGGGGIIWKPRWAKGLGFVLTGEAVTGPLTEGFRPNIGVGLQFDFH